MATEVQWSELQRDPKSVAALADQGEVRVRRRDGAALLLIREDQANSTAQGAVLAARALRNIVVHLPPAAAATALIDEFPWVDALPPDDRSQFVTDFVRAFLASAELGEWSRVAQTIREWQNTAVVHADPALAEELARPLTDDFGPIPHPTEA